VSTSKLHLLLTLIHPNYLIILILVSLHWYFALVFDVFLPNLTLLTFELITSHHGQILGSFQEHQDAQDPNQFSPSPPCEPHKTKHTLDKHRKSLEKQASLVLQGIENQVDSAPTSPGNYSDLDEDMARKKLAQDAKKRANDVLNGGA